MPARKKAPAKAPPKKTAARAVAATSTPTRDAPIRVSTVEGRTPEEVSCGDERLRALIHSYNEHGKPLIVTADHAPNPYQLKRPTGLMEVDIILGGGFPAGCCSMTSGGDNAGKTHLILKTMAMQQRLYGNACRLAFATTEGGFPFDQALNAGLKVAVPDEIIEQWQAWRHLRNIPLYTPEQVLFFKQQIGEVYVIRGATGEDILQCMLDIIRTNACSIVACDSINGLMPAVDSAKELDQASMRAAHANMITKFFNHYNPITTGFELKTVPNPNDKSKTLEMLVPLRDMNKTTVLFTQQVRSNQERANAPSYMQANIKAWAISGGYASKHFKAIDLVVEDLAPIKRGEKETRETIGKRVAFYTEKGKHGTHDNLRCESSYYYALGDYDIFGELLTSGIKHGIIRQQGSKVVVVRFGTNDVIEAFTCANHKILRQVVEVDVDLELCLRREILAAAGKQCLYQ